MPFRLAKSKLKVSLTEVLQIPSLYNILSDRFLTIKSYRVHIFVRTCSMNELKMYHNSEQP